MLRGFVHLQRLMRQQNHRALRVAAGHGLGQVGAVAREVVAVKIVDARDVEMLEDLVLAAISEAQGKAQTIYEEEMRKAAGGLPMNLPGLPNLF